MKNYIHNGKQRCMSWISIYVKTKFVLKNHKIDSKILTFATLLNSVRILSCLNLQQFCLFSSARLTGLHESYVTGVIVFRICLRNDHLNSQNSLFFLWIFHQMTMKILPVVGVWIYSNFLKVWLHFVNGWIHVVLRVFFEQVCRHFVCKK